MGLVRSLYCWLAALTLGFALGCFAAEPTPQPLPRLETQMHTAPIVRIATDAAGRWAVTASDDKTARVWDIASGRPLAVLRPPQDAGNEGKLYAVALSPDGAMVALGGWTGRDGERNDSIYLFERASGRLLRRLPGLPNVIKHLAFSPDGRWLAASLGAGEGVRVFDAASGQETGHDADYGGTDSYSAHFSPDGRRLLTTAEDGQLRLYPVAGGRLGAPKLARPGGGKDPFAARFSPDGRRIAVGFDDSTVVQVLDAGTLAEVARPNTAGVDNGDISSVAWSADGRFLVAGGRWDVAGRYPVRRWLVGDWSRYSDLPLAENTLMDFAPLPDGALLFAAGDPAWGVFDPAGALRYDKKGATADLRGPQRLRVSADGRRVGFSYTWPAQEPSAFDLARRSLGADAAALAAPRTAAPGLAIKNWEHRTDPTLNGRQLTLERHEESKSLAIAPDAQRFVLGTDWWLRQFDRTGRERWRQPVPGVAWAVNISADARFVVAAYGDGTIRWHRFDDGREVLALFPHADQKRWIAWTPEGFYATSGPDAEALLGYHLNRGPDREGEFVSARQLQEKFYQPGLIARRLDADGDALLGEAVKALGDVRQLLAGAQAAPPLVESVTVSEPTDEGQVTITVKLKDQGGGIGDVVFYVDGQPQSGRQAGGVSDHTFSRTFPLPQGRRLIEVAGLNRARIEGQRKEQIVEVRGPVQDAALHVLAIGVKSYENKDLSLEHSASDARKIADEIAARARPLFERGVAKTVLIDHDATLSGIEQAFGDIRTRMKPQDTLVIFLAGHGEAPIGTGYTFLPWDFRRGATGTKGEGLNEKRILAMLKASPPRTLLLLDTCDAGGAAEMLEGAYERLYGVSKHVVIGASRRGEFAKEGYKGHGVFTAALLRVMQSKPEDELDRRLSVTQLRASVATEVRRIVREMGSNSGQTVSGYLGSADFPVLMR